MATGLSTTGELRWTLHGMAWQAYEGLLADPRNRKLRMAYDRGDLELMSPGFLHERLSQRLGRLVEALAEARGVPFLAGGSTTFRREDLARGLEPDRCFYFRNAPRMCAQRTVDLSSDPPPDLAIEIDLSRSSLNRFAIYAEFGVPELWRCDGERLEMYRLAESREYESLEFSAEFPSVQAAAAGRLILDDLESDDLAWLAALRIWVAQ